MAMDLHGILNQNEYYTNHYFTTIFEENASDTIASWRQSAKDNESLTPWAAFRDTSRNYYRIREKYLQLRNEDGSRELIEGQASEYIAALGYGEHDGINIELNDEITLPVFHEVKKPNGAPLLWVLLSVAKERDDDILMGRVFGRRDADDEEYDMLLSENNDEVLAKLFFAGAEAPRWIILIGINQIALIDRNKWDKKKYLQFDLEEIFSRHEETTFQALAVLLHKESLCPAEGNSLLDALDENSYKHSSSVSDSLKYALRECIELLGNEVLYDMRTRQQVNFDENPVDAGELTIECLRYMYRILFMLFIEAREELGFAPMKSDVYQKGYSLEGVRDVCESVREVSAEAEDGYYIDETISSLFELIYTGYPEDPEAYKEALKIESPKFMFTIEPLKAHIFDPQYTKLINEAKLRNVTMLKIVDLMSISRPTNSRERRGRISYSALGINQMGAVYEALLSYRGFIAEEDLYEVKRAGDKFNELDVGYFVPERELDNYTEEERVRYEDYERRGKLRMYEKGTFVYRLAGREREKSASYYTPEVLTKCLVKYALKELLKDKKADEILNMTVCEPAMGSAAFLNEAISQLAEAYLDKKQEELGEQIAFDKRTAELQRVKMFIADRNVYGVDLNPIAVELAEVSLWLNTIYKGAHVPWFGTQLACGNSLIGARRQVYNSLKLKKGTWYNEEPEKVPEDWVTDRHETRKVYKRKRSGGSYIYHFLLGDPSMANYTDKVIKDLEPDNIKLIKQWQKDFCAKYSDDDIEILNKLSDLVDDLWMRTIYARQRVEIRTEDSLSVYGHDEGAYKEHLTIREKDAIYQNIYKSIGGDNASPYARLKAAMDYWCALWFWPIDKASMLPTRQEFFMDLSLILEGGISAVVEKHTTIGQYGWQFDANNDSVGYGNEGTLLANEIQNQISGLGVVNLEQIRALYPRLKIADDIAKQQRFMHWELEFADLFYERGGFDLVIGNPPWRTIEWKINDVISDFQPIIYIKNAALTDDEKYEFQMETFDNTSWRESVLAEYISISGQQAYLDSPENYSILKGIRPDLYKAFLPKTWALSTDKSIVGLLHPEGVFDDASGGLFRKHIYRRLICHYQFINQKKLFDIGNTRPYSINIYSFEHDPNFDAMFYLFDPRTIDESYELDSNKKTQFGIKDQNGNWNEAGDNTRIIRINEKSLKSYVGLLDDEKDWQKVRMPMLYSNEIGKAIEIINSVDTSVFDAEDKILYTEMLTEPKGGSSMVKLQTCYPEDLSLFVYAGPNIGISNPLFKTARRICVTQKAFDPIDLSFAMGENTLRSKYTFVGKIEDLRNDLPRDDNNASMVDYYRIASRKMIDKNTERSLISSIIPPKALHMDSLYSILIHDEKKMVIIQSAFSSLVADFLVKMSGKSTLRLDLLGHLQISYDKYINERLIRILLLNSLNYSYGKLWSDCWCESFSNDKWAKKSRLLDNNAFTRLSKVWNPNYIIRTDFARRQLLIENDVLCAMSLGLTIEELKTIYRLYFPVLKQYEDDTWYDADGRIVFTVNRSLTNVGFTRNKWEIIKNAKTGIFTQTITDDTMPGGPVERTIEYVAPFDRCDREKDYEEVWKNFEERFKK